ncbi:MAG: hypothetical protein AAGH40_14790 [Verrucomicrobiota bacterium]
MKTKYNTYLLTVACLLGCLILTGCNQTTQTTSGTDYISKYPNNPTARTSSIDEEVKEIASVEPILQFPARIGVAKIFQGELVNLHEEEALAWQEARSELGSDFGEFIPVSPLIAEMVYTAPSQQGKPDAKEVVRKIRLAAARQHLDAVLIYEVFSKSSEQTLSTSIAYWTIIGAYVVPSEQVETVGYANALLLDVRNGYPYGTATATASMKDVNTLIGHYDQKRRQEMTTQIAASLNLVPETVEMFRTLKGKLPTG